MAEARKSWIEQLVLATADAAFAIDDSGYIVAWNTSAEELFGLKSTGTVGRPCRDILRGADETGAVCSDHCAIKRALESNSPMTNFDLKIQTAIGRQWCNISVLIVNDSSRSSYAMHIVHLCEKRKRLERLVKDFIANEAKLASQSGSQPANAFHLSGREIEVLKMLAKSMSTDEIAAELCISCSTVRTHVKHIMAKLGVHTRLHAVRRAQKAVLI